MTPVRAAGRDRRTGTGGNHEWDTRRFFEKALSDEVEAGVFEQAELNDWEPA